MRPSEGGSRRIWNWLSPSADFAAILSASASTLAWSGTTPAGLNTRFICTSPVCGELAHIAFTAVMPASAIGALLAGVWEAYPFDVTVEAKLSDRGTTFAARSWDACEAVWV